MVNGLWEVSNVSFPAGGLTSTLSAASWAPNRPFPGNTRWICLFVVQMMNDQAWPFKNYGILVYEESLPANAKNDFCYEKIGKKRVVGTCQSRTRRWNGNPHAHTVRPWGKKT